MKGLKVNADYEAVLFGKKSLPVVNEALEFLAFFLDPRPLKSLKKYDESYLAHVEGITGRKPIVRKDVDAQNWWGSLSDIPLEQKLNSKIMSAELTLREGWCSDTFIIESEQELSRLKEGQSYIAKSPFGMSGMNIARVSKSDLTRLPKGLPLVIEPLLDRKFDFSHYIFPNGEKICYQNLVDQKFQYKGTLFRDYTEPTVQNLQFYSELAPSDWGAFAKALEVIRENYQTETTSFGYSVDSFIYRSDGELKIRYLSEVNYRRTMGEVAFELAVRFGGLRKWAMFLLVKKSELSFLKLKEKLAPLAWKADHSRGIILLSPDDVRYEMYFLSALNENEGLGLVRELNNLLPHTQLAVEF